jgi:hypothetical protein
MEAGNTLGQNMQAIAKTEEQPAYQWRYVGEFAGLGV